MYNLPHSDNLPLHTDWKHSYYIHHRSYKNCIHNYNSNPYNIPNRMDWLHNNSYNYNNFPKLLHTNNSLERCHYNHNCNSNYIRSNMNNYDYVFPYNNFPMLNCNRSADIL